ncbi:BatD family protein [Chthonobacter rhizosphaerae]|uniref:BatD family protein n=1 Tax=Chthonobacter rhizosphaerae TaxID=2735553 RepID=UPI0015EE5CCC|nr:BatD family protein [Chthonobacter rhizosphaerae]
MTTRSAAVALTLVLALALTGLIGPASAASTHPGIRLWVDVENAGPEIRPQEMVILKVRARFRVPVTLEKMEDPKEAGFRLVRVGRDLWFDVFEDGLTIRAFERTVAVFPQRSGTVVIPPFVHHLTILDEKMKTRKIDVLSEPVPLQVVPAPAPADVWWIPARRFTVTDAWSVPPERLAVGQSTRRTLTIEAEGVFDDQIPPAPALKADGLIVFPGVPERETRIGLGAVQPESELALRDRSLRRPGRLKEVKNAPEGPIARVVYSWDIRPTTDRPVTLPAVTMPWYDVTAGAMRTVEIPARTVALAAGNRTPDVAALELALGIVAPTDAPPGAGRGLPMMLAGLAGAVAFVATLGLALALVAPDALRALVAGRRRSLVVRRERRLLRRAARRRDGVALRAAVTSLAGAGRLDPATLPDLPALDRHLYADPPGPAPDHRRLAEAVIRSLRPPAGDPVASPAARALQRA